MTLMEFFGCSMIAFGPSLAMLLLTIAKDPIRVIILISSTFFWLLSLLLSSILYAIVYPLKDELSFGVIFSVIFQEVFRYFFYRLLRKAEVGLKKVEEVGAENTSSSCNRLVLAYVAGLGFGMISGAFSLVNVLADSIGPGTVGLKGDSHFFFLASAFTTLAFVLLHTFWGVIFFTGFDHKRFGLVAFVLVSHLFVSLMTLLNQQQLYLASLLPVYAVTCVAGVLAFSAAGGSWHSLVSAICPPPPMAL